MPGNCSHVFTAHHAETELLYTVVRTVCVIKVALISWLLVCCFITYAQNDILPCAFLAVAIAWELPFPSHSPVPICPFCHVVPYLIQGGPSGTLQSSSNSTTLLGMPISDIDINVY